MRLTEEQYAALERLHCRDEEAKATPKPYRKRKRSSGEVDLEMQLRAWGIEGWRTEHPFDAGTGGRKWKLDFCWPELKLAVEVDGGVHRIAGRFEGDIDKHNALQFAGWMYLRVSPEQCKSGDALSMIRAALDVRQAALAAGDNAHG